MVRSMARVVLAYGLELYPNAACEDCTARYGGPNWMAGVRSHIQANRTHRVRVERVKVSVYEWEE